MPKVTLDRETFKVLASDTRLDILRTLDGKKLGLNEISKATNLNKATLHEHLSKLHEAGLVKRKEREGHKWVYYKLTWKGESLLHPENTRIVVLFSTTFIALWVGIIQLIWYIQGTIITAGSQFFTGKYSAESTGNVTDDMTVAPTGEIFDNVPENSRLLLDQNDGGFNFIYQDPVLLYIAIACFIIFTIVLAVALWRLWKNKTPKL